MKKLDMHMQREDQKVIVVTSDGKMIEGTVNIMGFDRLSDYLQKHGEQFFMLYDATSSKDKTLFILKEHVVSVEPIDD